MRVKENYGRDAPSRIPAVRLELSEMRGRRFMAEIQLEKTALGLELGSTRIKAVLIGPEHAVLASGARDWENRQEHGYWTYALDDVWAGVQDAFARLARQVQERYGTPLHTVGAMGVSGMMHGYLPFARDGAQLAAFRTWRHPTPDRAAARLTDQAVARLILGVEALARGTAVTVVLVAVVIAIIVAVVVVLAITLVVTLLAAKVHLIFNLVKEAHGCVLSRFSAGAL